MAISFELRLEYGKYAYHWNRQTAESEKWQKKLICFNFKTLIIPLSVESKLCRLPRSSWADGRGQVLRNKPRLAWDLISEIHPFKNVWTQLIFFGLRRWGFVDWTLDCWTGTRRVVLLLGNSRNKHGDNCPSTSPGRRPDRGRGGGAVVALAYTPIGVRFNSRDGWFLCFFPSKIKSITDMFIC